MWTARSETLSAGRVLKFSIDMDAAPISYGDVLRRWQDDAEFRTFFGGLLAGVSYTAFRWETPPPTHVTSNRPFEFVLLDSPGLERAAEPEAFAEHFHGATGDVVECANLSKDAVMVVPCPRRPDAAYGHLAAFVRTA